MTGRTNRTGAPRRATVVALAVGLVAAASAACTGGGRHEVTIFGPEVDAELERMQAVMADFSDRTGIPVTVEGTRDFEDEIGGRIDAGDPPDIALFPQPGRISDLRDDLLPLRHELARSVESDFPDDLTDLVRFDGELWAAPVKIDLKSLVWYSPARFRAAGYTVPRTFDDFLALADRMALDHHPPFCVGIESGEASGWPLTDWIEDFVLRVAGPDVYDRWAAHEIPFDDPAIVRAAEMVFDLWAAKDHVYGGLEGAAVTGFADAGLPVLDGGCMMYRQSNFYMIDWPAGTTFGPDGDIDAFRLPGSSRYPDIALSGALFATTFGRSPETVETMAFLASADFADAMARQPTGGFLSGNRGVDISLYPDVLSRSFAEILRDADPVRFDASDLMPGVVGSGTYWTAAVDITTGTKSVAEAFAEVEANWPDDV